MAEGASVAPAAPSTGAAPSQAPQAPPEAAPKAAEGTSQLEPRQIKPIPDKPAADKKVARPDLGFATNKDKTTDGEDIIPSLPRRDPETGKFLSKHDREAKLEAEMFQKPELPEGDEGDTKKQDTKKLDAKPELPPDAAKKVTFLGKEYKDIAEVEQKHRTLEGMHRKALDERNYGYQAANAWKARAEALEAMLDKSPASGTPPQNTQAATPPGNGKAAAATAGLNLDEILQGLDGDAVEMVAVQGGLPQATRFIGEEILGAVVNKIIPALRAEIKGELQTELAPYHQSVQEAQMEDAQEQAVLRVADFTLTDGTPAFPEVENEQALEEIAAIWSRSGLPPEMIFTEAGLIQAIAVYRMLKGWTPQAAQSAAQQALAAITPPPQQTGVPGAAALVPETPGSLTPSVGDRQVGNQSPATRRLLSALSKTHLVDPDLGFARRPRT